MKQARIQKNIVVRPARSTEAAALSAIARQAKESVGYPQEWLDHWEPELTITSAFIDMNPVFVAEAVPEAADRRERSKEAANRSREVVGIVALEDGPDGPEVAHLWVLPKAQRRGIGRLLIDRAVSEARSQGWHTLRIVSDPSAVMFYERMGARRAGSHPAPVAGHARELPVLQLSIATV